MAKRSQKIWPGEPESKKKRYFAYGYYPEKSVEITFSCPCGAKDAKVSVSSSSIYHCDPGPCQCGDYCYCASAHDEVHVNCPSCGADVDLEISR